MPDRSPLCCAVSLGLWLTVCAAVWAQGDEHANTPLATKQQIIRDRILRLEDQIYRLIEELKTPEPKQAQRLQEVLATMSELNVRQDLNEIIAVLNTDRLEVAVEQQSALLGDLASLMALLTSPDDLAEERRREIERLEGLVEQLDGLISDEQRLEEASDAARLVMEGARPDAQAAAAIEEVLAGQQAVLADTLAKYNKQADAKSDEALKQEQQSVTDQADELARMLRDKGESSAAKQVESARLNMQDASDELAEQSYGAAGDAQEDAVKDLQRALEKLTKKVPQEQDEPDLEGLAREQAELGAKTDELAQNMTAEQQPTPGQEEVEMAGENMEQAADSLKKHSPSAAQQQQQQALERLDEARARLEQELDALKRAQQEQKLADLEKKFKDMLATQQSINRATERLAQLNTEQWNRARQLQAVEQKQKQETLSGQAGECLGILEEDATTTVLPILVEHVRDDMAAVARRLGDFKVGPITRQMQADVVQSLEDILGAIEDRLGSSGSDNQDQRSQGQPGDPPLLPATAELKLLVNLQERVFQRTRTFDRAAPEERGELLRIAEQQTDVARMATEMSNKLKAPRGPVPEEERNAE